jgi:hypothetical protein
MPHDPGKKAGKRQLVAVHSRPFSFQAKPNRNNGAERQKRKKSLILFIEERTHTKAGEKGVLLFSRSDTISKGTMT